MLTHLSIQYKKQHPFINITSNHNALRNCQPRRGKCKFSKILNCTWKLEFYNWQQLLSVIFLWSGELISFIFTTVSAKCPNLDNSPLSVFEVRIIFHEKRGSFSSQCNLSHESLSSKRPSYLCLQQNCYTRFPTLSHRTRILKRQGSIFNTLNNFHCFIKDILKPNWLFFFFLQMHGGKKHSQWLLFQLMPLPRSHSSTSSFTHVCFCTINAHFNTEKRYNNIFVLIWK